MNSAAPTLLIFDEALQPDAVAALGLSGPVALFALTGNWFRVRAIAERLAAAGSQVTVLESARAIDDEVSAMRQTLPQWTDRLAAARAGTRGTVLQWLTLPGMPTSAYWLGSVSERNPFKTPELLYVAQARAVAGAVASHPYHACVVALDAPPLQRAFVRVTEAAGLRTRTVTAATPLSARQLARRVSESSGRIAASLVGLAVLARCCWRAWLARGLRLGTAPRSPSESPVLIVTYYPYVDKAAAAAGDFRNKFFGPLQPHLEAAGRTTRWAGIFVHIDGWSFRDAVRLTHVFRRRGVTLLDAYLSPRRALRLLVRACRLGWRAARLEQHLHATIDSLAPPGAGVLARQLWRRSFMGADLVRGLYYLEVFDALVRETSDAGICLYFVEFQAWEQALIAVLRRRAPHVRTVAFQHTSVSRNHYFYFRTRFEIERTGAATDMPLPDVVAASGALPADLLAESRFAAITEVESIRQLHLAEVVARTPETPPTRELLVAGSIDAEETRALLSMVASAWPDGSPFAIRLKAHPSMPMARLLADLGLASAGHRFETVDGTVGEALARAAIVLVASSAVAVEALAYGCEVVVPAFASFPCLTPLSGFEDYYRRVYTPDQLRREVEEYFARGPRRLAAEKVAFARRYWRLDRSLRRWDALLSLPAAADAAPA